MRKKNIGHVILLPCDELSPLRVLTSIRSVSKLVVSPLNVNKLFYKFNHQLTNYAFVASGNQSKRAQVYDQAEHGEQFNRFKKERTPPADVKCMESQQQSENLTSILKHETGSEAAAEIQHPLPQVSVFLHIIR